ncbi:protein of unknown function [Hyphomicrobium sp. MC1]|nr:protein of unknown function [Hyphomicrobium sp. MC1]
MTGELGRRHLVPLLLKNCDSNMGKRSDRGNIPWADEPEGGSFEFSAAKRWLRAEPERLYCPRSTHPDLEQAS